MENNEEVKIKKLNFFKKMWYSITNFEKYPYMAAEGVGRAISYLIGITAIFVLVVSISVVYKSLNIIEEKLTNEVPEISYSNNQLTVNSDVPIKIETGDTEGIQKIIIDTKTENEEVINTYLEELETGILLLNDKIIAKNIDTVGDKIEYTYSDIINNLGLNITEFTKQDILNYMNSPQMFLVLILTMFIYLVIIYIFTILIDSITLSLLGAITTMFVGLKIKYAALFNMSVYALTLSIILNIIYVIVNCFIQFTIEYFQVAYIAIAYIYLIAVIFIIKYDFIKKQAELMKIIEEQKNKKENNEIEKDENQEQKENDQEEKEEENKQENEKDNNLGGEPKGSET